jgi:NADPH:quinone reductase-like Zn-dependent oxidoreductase
MRAVVFRKHGRVDVLRVEEVPTPVPGPGEVLIKVRTCSVNRDPDLTVRQTSTVFRGLALPHVLGLDPAGEVTSVGAGVTGIPLGHRVATYPLMRCDECDFCRRGTGENYCRRSRMIGVHTWGGYAEYVKVPAQNVVPIPMSVSWEAASALSLSYATAWHGLVTKARVGAADSILVMAAGSSVGVAAVQIARLHGARVIAAAGADWKLERARALGADAGVNYSKEGWAEKVLSLTEARGVDVIFETVGKTTWRDCLRCLNQGGRVVSCGATAGGSVRIDLRALSRDHNTLGFWRGGTSGELRYIIGLVASGKLQPVIDSRFPLEEARSAQQRLIDRANFGKVIMTPQPR